MDSTNPAKRRRKAGSEPPRPGDDEPGTTLPANLSLTDLHRLIEQRVVEIVKVETLALTSRVDGLQRENEGLLRRCESLERSVQVLKKEGNWTYSAPDVPSSHWIDQGHDEDYADEAENLIQSIKDKTNGLRSGDGNDELIFGGEIPILSDNALDHHWKQLVNAIQLSERITKLILLNIQLDQRSLQMIETSLRQKGIGELWLDSNEFHGGEGVQFAIGVLKSNISVKKFSWDNNSFHITEDACKLVDAVVEHPTISEVSFMGSFNDGITTYSPVQRLFRGLGTDTLLNVNLIDNGIKTNGDRCIPDFLSTNPPLRNLYLRGNRLTDNDALHITVALQSNTNLRFLNLRDNQLTEDGKDVTYHQAIFGISPSDLSKANLNTVSDANHTCQVDGVVGNFSLTPGSETLMNRSYGAIKWNRRRKLLWLLEHRHRKGRNTTQIESEFSGDCLGIVPHVLACINTYAKANAGYATDDVSKFNLSLLFELARDWKTPEMYQLHHAA